MTRTQAFIVEMGKFTEDSRNLLMVFGYSEYNASKVIIDKMKEVGCFDHDTTVDDLILYKKDIIVAVSDAVIDAIHEVCPNANVCLCPTSEDDGFVYGLGDINYGNVRFF